ncbi:hypothetical protein [Hafnia psychrotolerans]|uniref:Uncharacterized protein n=1 Tax=Hafnia psychrotolerans TaxID=1477018 RepID=A0ABQ1H615_9GAMM|nr:hypothetical protein [Hafnia psychrotolerans]GGA59915.1 hypothetical protein GCM10011328_39220 [Hafnia psychrotolerans]
MFTIVLWDVEKYQQVKLIENYADNEVFLAQSDQDKYPLLSQLTYCDEELFSNDELIGLSSEINELKMESVDTEISAYLESVENMIAEAISTHKSILITPFVD